MMMHWLTKIWKELSKDSDDRRRDRIEEYLASSVDLPDLEHRIKAIENGWVKI